ncbi:MAG: DUF6036 family nucleotidyltransferase [Acidimicrobiia bacterium]
MRRDQLEHLIRAAGELLGEDRIVVIGSQAILASFPHGLPAPAVVSVEADLLPLDDPQGEKALEISRSIGEASRFQETHGIYADGVEPGTARLPAEWQTRLIPICNENTNGVTGLCLEAYDLCASKLLAGRHKDFAFCGALLAGGHLDPSILRARIPYTDASHNERERIAGFLNRY